ncbi:heavy-metal-associated domain-containing protein [Pseudonocardia sichuanensis]
MGTTINVQVEGMTCTGCEQRIGTALRRIDGVREVSADHTSGRVRVRFDPGTTGPDAVLARIILAGYTVRDDGPAVGGGGR